MVDDFIKKEWIISNLITSFSDLDWFRSSWIWGFLISSLFWNCTIWIFPQIVVISITLIVVFWSIVDNVSVWRSSQLGKGRTGQKTNKSNTRLSNTQIDTISPNTYQKWGENRQENGLEYRKTLHWHSQLHSH